MHVTWRLNNDGRVQVFCPACKGCVLTVLLTNSQISFTHSSGNNVNCQYLRRTPLLVWLYLMFSRVLALRYDWTGRADPHLPLLERFKLIFHSPPPHATPCLSASFPSPRETQYRALIAWPTFLIAYITCTYRADTNSLDTREPLAITTHPIYRLRTQTFAGLLLATLHSDAGQ
jgi:hypothetical protein